MNKAVVDINDVMRKIYTVNLGVKSNEKVLVFTDIIKDGERILEGDARRRLELQELAKDLAEIGEEFCSTEYLEFPSVMGHGKEPPQMVWEACFGKKVTDELTKKGVLKKIMDKAASPEDLKTAEDIIVKGAKSPDAIIALSNFSTSHTRFRDFLTRCMGVRYASMPLFEKSMLSGAMTADWNEVKERTLRLVKKMSGADMVYITTPNGTSISFSMQGRDPLPDTGIITEKGSFSNLPAGEGFLAPLEGTAEGVLVLEWAPTKKLHRPISLIVKGGRVVDIDGEDEFAHDLREKLSVNPLIGNIAELGIGTNEKAERPDNILETEKILGTIHIALGDNSSFGGKVAVPFHQDFIFFKPTLEVIRGEQKIEVIIEGEPRF
ncbi:MAG: aminopeptidase [Deltaproteobacteria bacterium]|nr:aminopeptidase [Deltaproteobacteria bacterium]